MLMILMTKCNYSKIKNYFKQLPIQSKKMLVHNFKKREQTRFMVVSGFEYKNDIDKKLNHSLGYPSEPF